MHRAGPIFNGSSPQCLGWAAHLHVAPHVTSALPSVRSIAALPMVAVPLMGKRGGPSRTGESNKHSWWSGRHTSRRSVAQRDSSYRLDFWVFRNTADTWVSTVLIEMNNCEAISL